MARYDAACSAPSVASIQDAIDAADVVGHWDWDIPADRLAADALVALLFNIEPDLAEAGVPLAAFGAGIHPDDRARIVRLIEEHAWSGRSYLAQYRVCSADGVTRWVLARGRFSRDGAGRPLRGRGLIIDVTRTRINEDASAVACSDTAGSPLERAARSFLEGYKLLETMQDQPQLRRLAEVLLFETGRALAAQDDQARRTGMN